MNIGEKIHGFTVDRIRKVNELDAQMVEMTFEKNGAKLIWLDRPDTNKTFSITFRTTPEDDTGVFHILEHSVLCGSEKFPLKEPFVDLLKGSMQTFLNAMTFSDKTMYPVSSKNDKDFLILTDVYLDAVFHPLIYKKKEIFMQEGWHFEQEEGNLYYNGVVYNEMQGVFSSVENRFIYELLPRLYPDTCYGCCSGGNPKSIPDLTYEGFLAHHKKFYHPSNSTIFLDGQIDLESVLTLIESYLEPYDYVKPDTEIKTQKPIKSEPTTVSYEASPEEDVFGKTEIAKGFVYSDFSDREKITALSILTSYLCATNESPLKKAILESGLASDVLFESDDASKQCSLYLILRNVKDENVQRAEETVKKVLRDLTENGIDKLALTAAFNRHEFETREQDFGSEPAGLVYAMKVEETALYGGDPYAALTYDDIFESLRKKLDTDYFEKLIKEAFLENEHTATIYFVPDKNLGEKLAIKEEEKLAKIQKSFSQDDLAKLEEGTEKLRLFQETPDTPEVSKLISHIELSDIDPNCEKTPLEKLRINETDVLHCPINTNGISYSNLYFSLAGLSKQELCLSAVLASMLCKNPTESHSAEELSVKIMTDLGNFSCSCSVYGEYNDCTPFFIASIGALESKKQSVVSLAKEVLCTTVFDEKKVSDRLAQLKINYENSVKSSGHVHSMCQVESCLCQKGAINEFFVGQSKYKFVCEFLEKPHELCELMSGLMRKIFSKERLTLAVIGKDDSDFEKALIDCFETSGQKIEKIQYDLCKEKKQFIPVTSNVSYASTGYNLHALGKQRSGQIAVASKILTLDYLWNEVRVKGGAYGVGVRASYDGNVSYYSYRDPQPERSLETYAQSGAALLKFANENQDITKYIIGAVSQTENVLSPFDTGALAIKDYFDNYTYEKQCLFRKQMLETTAEDLKELSKLFELEKIDCATCVIGSK